MRWAVAAGSPPRRRISSRTSRAWSKRVARRRPRSTCVAAATHVGGRRIGGGAEHRTNLARDDQTAMSTDRNGHAGTQSHGLGVATYFGIQHAHADEGVARREAARDCTRGAPLGPRRMPVVAVVLASPRRPLGRAVCELELQYPPPIAPAARPPPPCRPSPSPRPASSTIDLIVRRAGTLYTLPAVAVEVLRLTEHPKADVRALRECLQQDPALTAKVLRVVNSSLFGLSHSVGDLNEAVALLGIKQLKLLVLGFSLPEQLFLDIAGEQLDWYWNSTLARAVAAREVSEQLFKRSGDEAFLAGLLQDLGVLVLLRELGGPYAALVSEAIAYRADLAALEQTAPGLRSRATHRRAAGPLEDAADAGARDRRAALREAAGQEPRRARPPGPRAAPGRAARAARRPASAERAARLARSGPAYCDLDQGAAQRPGGGAGAEGAATGRACCRSTLSRAAGLRRRCCCRRTRRCRASPRSSPVPSTARRATAAGRRTPRKTHPATGTVSLQEVHAAVAAVPRIARSRRGAAAVRRGAGATTRSRSRETWSREELRRSRAASPRCRSTRAELARIRRPADARRRPVPIGAAAAERRRRGRSNRRAAGAPSRRARRPRCSTRRAAAPPRAASRRRAGAGAARAGARRARSPGRDRRGARRRRSLAAARRAAAAAPGSWRRASPRRASRRSPSRRRIFAASDCSRRPSDA